MKNLLKKIPKQLSNEKLNSIFINACKTGDLDTVKQIYADFKPKKNAFFHFLQITNLLPKLDLHCEQDSPFIYAALEGHIEIIEFLLSDESFRNRVKSNNRTAIALSFAIEDNALPLLKLLLPIFKKSEISYDLIEKSFIKACYRGNIDVIKHIIADEVFNFHEYDKKYRSADKYPLLHLGFISACQGGQVELMKLLESFGNIQLDKIITTIKINKIEVMRHLIFDLNIKEKDTFMFSLDMSPELTEETKKLFEKKELFNKLNSHIGSIPLNPPTKRVKL